MIAQTLKPEVTRFLARQHKMLIDGEWCSAISNKSFAVDDPSTGAVVAHVPEGEKADIDLAVRAARQSFDARVWRGLSAEQRMRILWRYADLIDSHAEELAQIDVVNNGMPLWLARAILENSASGVRYAANIAATMFDRNLSNAISSSTNNVHAYTSSSPVGVAALILPWNGPAGSFLVKVGSALAAGCSCIVKPSELTPLSALRLGELALEAGIPPGVLNIVTGFGTAGEALVEHSEVDKISFTGSTTIGKRIVQAVSTDLKRVSLELGGKSPSIVFDDADLDIAIRGAAMGIFLNTGQLCIAGSRLFAQRKVFDSVVSGIAEVARSMKIGSGFMPDTQLGPVISEKQRTQVMQYIANGCSEGAELVTGGSAPSGSGYFVEPTILANVNGGMRVVREEVFGPVLVVTPFDELDEVVAMANDSRYGLAAGIFTNDVNKAHLVADALHVGNVWVNCYGLTHPTLPFGGFKESGWGREFGPEGIEAFLEKKSVAIQLR